MKQNKKQYPCIEYTLEINDLCHGEWRLWVNLDQLKLNKKQERELTKIIKQIKRIINSQKSIISKHRLLAKISKVNAVQYRRRTPSNAMCGIVIYTIDFSEDVHG